MRGLILAADLAQANAIAATLRELGVESDSSLAVGSGVVLGSRDLSAYSFAIAFLSEGARVQGADAVLVEIGVAVGAGIPVMVVQPYGDWPRALATLPRVTADLGNRAALSLHIGSFVKSLGSAGVPVDAEQSRSPLLDDDAVYEFRQRLESIRNGGRGFDPRSFERLVFDILRAGGALIETPIETDFGGPDAAMVIPGDRERLGVMLVEAKLSLDDPTTTQTWLQGAVIHSYATLGLLIHADDRWGSGRSPLRSVPLIMVLSIEGLLVGLSSEGLVEMLTAARNAAIHGM